MKFIISGGLQTMGNSVKKYFKSEIGSDLGILAIVDYSNKKIKIVKELKSNRQFNYEGKGKDIRYTSCSIHDKNLYVASPTEVYIYNLPSLSLKSSFSHPLFNDLHHVRVIGEELYVVSTGFDAVLIFNLQFELLRIENVLGKDPFHRFSRNADLRTQLSTKPHESHPNFISKIGSDIFVTRFHQKDAVSLSNPDKRFNIGTQKIHDGHEYENKIYFTSVDGKVIVFNKETLEKEEVIDLNKIITSDSPLGWCRSLAKVDNYLFVGFTKLRSTKVEDNLLWISSKLFQKGKVGMPTRIVRVNLDNHEIVDEFVLPNHKVNLLFSIIPIEDSLYKMILQN